ncbi:MAG TPA: low molecular weight protein-tyrosine-phosphatase [Solirubrobacteraceae bacterium]|nr:low molecular weight protein-tyrosine-phosphatase [Solirubrobacteraceae bacterium]
MARDEENRFRPPVTAARRPRTTLLFVCLGNICRSPTAEGVMRRLVADRGLEDSIEVDSAGTAAWHVGKPSDPRSVAAALRRGVVLDGRARQVTEADFERFDLLVAMDRANERDLIDTAPSAAARAKVRLLLDDADVPDPYYGGDSGFDDVLDLVEAGCSVLLDELVA